MVPPPQQQQQQQEEEKKHLAVFDLTASPKIKTVGTCITFNKHQNRSEKALTLEKIGGNKSSQEHSTKLFRTFNEK